MTIRVVCVIAVLATAGCDKKSSTAAGGAAASPSAAGSAGEPGSAEETGSVGSAEAVAVAAQDPWAGPPPGADTKLGEACGDKLEKIDPWAGGSAPPALDAPVDLATIEQPVATKVGIGDFGGVTGRGFRVVYNPSKNPNHEQYRELFVSNRIFDGVAESLNRTVRLPRSVDINTVSCNTINAFYDPLGKRIIICYELLDYFLGIFKATAKDNAELGNAVMGATMFGLVHEIGHGLIDLLDLPAVGREEDSADQLATLTLMASGDQGVAMALAGAHWFRLQSKTGHKTPFWDEHAFDEQRFYNILCLVFGSDPFKHAAFIEAGYLPEERARRCPAEYARIKKAWEQLLSPHLTNGAALNIDYQPSIPVAEAPRTTTTDPWANAPRPTPPLTPIDRTSSGRRPRPPPRRRLPTRSPASRSPTRRSR